MRLLDKPLTPKEKDFTLDMVKGEICRICISDDPEEIVKMLGFATSNLSMVAYSRIKELKERELNAFLDE